MSGDFELNWEWRADHDASGMSYIYIYPERQVERTVELPGGVNLDLDAKGKVVGFEYARASGVPSPETEET